MPLPLAVSCFSKIQIGFTFLVPAHPDSPGKRAVKRVCVCVCVCVVRSNTTRCAVCRWWPTVHATDTTSTVGRPTRPTRPSTAAADLTSACVAAIRPDASASTACRSTTNTRSATPHRAKVNVCVFAWCVDVYSLILFLSSYTFSLTRAVFVGGRGVEPPARENFWPPLLLLKNAREGSTFYVPMH